MLRCIVLLFQVDMAQKRVVWCPQGISALREVSGMVPEGEIRVDVDGMIMNVRTFTTRHVGF
jgi:hypothetical protein